MKKLDKFILYADCTWAFIAVLGILGFNWYTKDHLLVVAIVFYSYASYILPSLIAGYLYKRRSL